MSTDKPLVNRIAQSGLITLKLEEFIPKTDYVVIDLKDHLFMELILKEKDFRESVKNINWSDYQDKVVLVYCSTDAIIPLWAYMLIAAEATPYAADIFQGTEEAYKQARILQAIDAIDPADYQDARLVVKGCGDQPVSAAAYLKITQKLQPVARSIMYGEPCSTVPIYKKPKARQ